MLKGVFVHRKKIAVIGVVTDAVAGVLKDVEICRRDVYKVV